jgi:S-adenosylmethionine:tRNA ribosyltransferase-isomerase
MTAADRIDRLFAKLLVADADGAISHLPRAALASLFRPGDLVVANDAATLPRELARRPPLHWRTNRGEARWLAVFS